MIEHKDCFDLMAEMEDNSVDIIYTDPPYNLSTKWEIKPNGKPDVKGSVKDFMLKWEGLDGTKLELLFKEFNRILKHGGRAIVFGIDRQIFPFEYYACLAGLQQQESLYWYFISAMPKATDLSKQLDKHFGEDREVVGKYKLPNGKEWNLQQSVNSDIEHATGTFTSSGTRTLDITAPSSDLAKKYDGLKYSVAPLKQTNEVMLVFQKPCKTGSVLHDVLAYENGDETISVSTIDIENNRVGLDDNCDVRLRGIGAFKTDKAAKLVYEGGYAGNEIQSSGNGRFPAQTFINSHTAEILDKQSGQSQSAKSTKIHPEYGENSKFGGGLSTPDNQYDDIGGCSRILHKCDYDEGDYDIYHYCPKVGKQERNDGLSDFKTSVTVGHNRFDKCKTCGKYIFQNPDRPTKCTCETPIRIDNEMTGNFHPTIKPLSLLVKILNLFKTPTKQIFFDPFAGSGSIPMACEILGLEWKACELDEEYCKIANARLEYAKANRIKLYKKYCSKTEQKSAPIVTSEFF